MYKVLTRLLRVTFLYAFSPSRGTFSISNHFGHVHDHKGYTNYQEAYGHLRPTQYLETQKGTPLILLNFNHMNEVCHI